MEVPRNSEGIAPEKISKNRIFEKPISEKLISEKPISGKKPKARWLLPVSVAATGLAGFAVLVTRGCWHRKMSWPVTVQGCSYRVCLGCGIKRLFDEPTFTSYGPYSYDLNKLTAWDRKRREKVA